VKRARPWLALLAFSLLIALSTGLLNRWYMAADNMPLANNEIEMLRAAQGLASGSTSLADIWESGRHPPLLQISAVPPAFLGPDVRGILVWHNALCTLIAAFCVAGIVLLLSENKNIAGPLYAAAAYCLISGVAGFSRVFTFEPLLAALSSAYVLALLWMSRKPSLPRALPAVIVGALGLYAKATFIVYTAGAALALFLICLRSKDRKLSKMLPAWALALLVPLALAAPWYVQNMARFPVVFDDFTPQKLSWSGGWAGYHMYRDGVPQNFFFAYLQSLRRLSTTMPLAWLTVISWCLLLLRRRKAEFSILASWAAGAPLLFFVIGLTGMHAIFCDRYVLPAIPCLAAGMGLAFEEAVEWAKEHWPRTVVLVSLLGISLLAAPLADLAMPAGPPDPAFPYIDSAEDAQLIVEKQGLRYDQTGILVPHRFDNRELDWIACYAGFGELEIRCHD